MSSKPTVAILFGGRSGEHDVSLMSANNVIDAIDKNIWDVVLVGISRDGKFVLGDEAARLLGRSGPAEGENPSDIFEALGGVDIAFPVLHGPCGEDGTVQGLLELIDVPFVGAGVLGSALGMDKVMMKKVLAASGLPVVQFVSFARRDWAGQRDDTLALASKFGFPCFVKPACLGSSVGVSKAHTTEELARAIERALTHGERVLVEEFVDAREIEVAVLGNHRPDASLPGEVEVLRGAFYDYDAKYTEGGARMHIPADIGVDLTARVRDLAVQTFVALDCAGLGRVDFFVRRSDSAVFVNEINTIPGFTQYSMYPQLWKATGMSSSELVAKLFQLAVERWEAQHGTSVATRKTGRPKAVAA